MRQLLAELVRQEVGRRADLRPLPTTRREWPKLSLTKGDERNETDLPEILAPDADGFALAVDAALAHGLPPRFDDLVQDGPATEKPTFDYGTSTVCVGLDSKWTRRQTSRAASIP